MLEITKTATHDKFYKKITLIIDSICPIALILGSICPIAKSIIYHVTTHDITHASVCCYH